MIRFDQLKKAATRTLNRPRRNRAGVMVMEQTSAQASRTRLRRALRRNRAGVIALLAAGALVALLGGVGAALHGLWFPTIPDPDVNAGRIPPRFGASVTYDVTNNAIVVFGGFNRGLGLLAGSFIPGAADRFDTYTHANDRWINRNPLHHPSPRGFASMVYDGGRKNVVLFGGSALGKAPNNETWVWDGVDWTQLHPPASPPARNAASMVYDAHRKKVVLFGGSTSALQGNTTVPFNSGDSLGDTWTWDGSTWTEVKAPEGPLPRHSAALGYDACRGETVLFGGGPKQAATPAFLPPDFGATWTFNGAAWTEKKNLTLKPLPRIGGSMTYSYASGRVLLYGGLALDDTGRATVPTDENMWMWDGTQWEHEIDNWPAVATVALTANVTTKLPPRAYASVVNNPHEANGTVTRVFGGTAELTMGVPLPDDWRFIEGQSLSVIPYRCVNPVPIPADEVPVGGLPAGQTGVQRKAEAREEIREIGRLPVLLGPDRKAQPEAPQPPCVRNEEPNGVGRQEVRDTQLVTDSRRNRIYQFFSCANADISHPKAQRVLIQAYDAKTLKPLGSAVAPMPHPTGNSGNVVFTLAPLHDAERGRFFLLQHGILWVIEQNLIEKGVDPVVQKTTLPATSFERLVNVTFFNHPKTGRAKLLLAHRVSNSTFTSSQVRFSQFDGGDGMQLTNSTERNLADWRSTVASCEGIEDPTDSFSRTPQVLMRAGDHVYASCLTQGRRGTVVKIPIAVNAEGTETAGAPELFPGPASTQGIRTWGDPRAERVLFLSRAGKGNTLWVFDGKISRYVGRVGLTIQDLFGGYELDQQTGRFYALVPDTKSVLGGLRVVETRLTPVPQAANFGQFTYTGEADIGILPPEGGLPTRLFVRRALRQTPSDPNNEQQKKENADVVQRYPDGEPNRLEDEMHYKVLADSLPVPEQPEIGQLDTLTIAVAEAPGKTEASFDAEGGGYGIRLRSVGGIAAALRLPPQNGAAELFTSAEGALATPGASPACFYSDRQLVAGWVSQVRLSDLETTARSSGLEVDASTKSDLEGVTTPCLPPVVSPTTFGAQTKAIIDVLWPLLPFAQLNRAIGSGILSPEAEPKDDDVQLDTGAGLAWSRNFKEVECVDESSESHKASIGDVYGWSDCKQGKGRVEGTARGALAGSLPSGYSAGQTSTSTVATSPVDYSVGEGYSNVVVSREPGGRGVVVTSTAVAKAIKLPNIYIDLVKTEAVVWSNGRPGANRATFTRTICGVVSPVYTNTNPGCLSEENKQKMVTEWNARWGINSKMTLPTPDPDLLRGSPGGYIAGVVKPLADEIQDQYFARDFQKEVPGLEIVFYKDTLTFGEARQTLQLAAVKAITGLGVQCNADLVYSPESKGCVALAFEDEFTEELGEDEESLSSDDAEPEFESEWEPVLTDAPDPLALGSKIGRFLENLPVVRLLPIRQMGEALLAASVWLLLGLPLLLASQRFAMNRARGVE